MRIKPGDKLEYIVEGDHVMLRCIWARTRSRAFWPAKREKACPSLKFARQPRKPLAGERACGEQAQVGRHKPHPPPLGTRQREASQHCWKTVRGLRSRPRGDRRVCRHVLAECVFVLESFYENPREEIASALGRLISSPGVEIADASIHLDALERYGKNQECISWTV